MSTPVSPKVHAAGIAAPLTTIAMYELDTQVPAIAAMPGYVHLALIAVVTCVITYAAGLWKSDPLRNLGAKFDNNPTTAPTKNEAGEIGLPQLMPLLVLATFVLVLLLFLGVHA